MFFFVVVCDLSCGVVICCMPCVWLLFNLFVRSVWGFAMFNWVLLSGVCF